MKKLEKNSNRVWEIDAARGILMMFLLGWHLYFTVNAFCINGYYHIDSYAWIKYTDPLHIWFRIDQYGEIQWARWIEFWHNTIYPGVDMFFIISGISCTFSRNNLRRALIILGAGLFVAIFTKGLAFWTGDPTRFIRFGALLCYAACQFTYVYFFEKLDSKWLLLSVIPIFAIGYYIRYVGVSAMRLPIFYIFGVPQIGDQSSDFWPVFPMLGWFLIGVVIGRKYYKEKKTLLPNLFIQKLTKPAQWFGRFSGILYVSHIVVYTAVFCGIGYLFGLL